MAKRLTRRERYRKMEAKRRARLPGGPCVNCGGEGSHFVPPCFGDPGQFVCEKGKPLDKQMKPMEVRP